MHRHYFARLGLCAPADDTPAPTTGDPSAPPSAEPKVETPPSTAPPEKPGVIDRALAMVRDKGSMAGEISTLKATNGTLLAENTSLKTQLATITAERDNLQAGFTRLESALATANKEKTTVETEVAHQLAMTGVPETSLPKTAAPPAPEGDDTVDGKINKLNKQIEESTDPREKGRLANEVWDLMQQRGGSFKVAKS